MKTENWVRSLIGSMTLHFCFISWSARPCLFGVPNPLALRTHFHKQVRRGTCLGPAWLPSPFLIAQCSICFPIWSAWLCTMPWLANYTFLIIDINERVTKEAIQPHLVDQNHKQQTVHCKGAYLVNCFYSWLLIIIHAFEMIRLEGFFLRFEIGPHWLKEVSNFPKIKHSSIWQILRSFIMNFLFGVFCESGHFCLHFLFLFVSYLYPLCQVASI